MGSGLDVSIYWIFTRRNHNELYKPATAHIGARTNNKLTTPKERPIFNTF
jgi:hypothetical protein